MPESVDHGCQQNLPARLVFRGFRDVPLADPHAEQRSALPLDDYCADRRRPTHNAGLLLLRGSLRNPVMRVRGEIPKRPLMWCCQRDDSS